MKTTTKTTKTEVMQTEIAEIKPVEIKSVIRDEFASEEYINPDAKLPRIQAMRGEDPSQCGYFIPTDQAAKAGWLNFDEKNLIDYAFASGDKKEQGLLFTSMRALVCPRTPVLALDKAATKEQEHIVFAGYYKKAIHKEDDNFQNFQAFDIILLDENNKPLHQVPLSLKLKGAAQASFSIEWGKFISDLTSCHAIVNGIPASEKTQMFKSLCVFAFTTKRELAGDKIKSPACKVVSYEKPTLETWKDYFVGFDSEVKDFCIQGLQPKRPLIQPDQIMAALPPVSDLEALAAAGIDF